MKPRVGAHQQRPPVVLDGPTHGSAWRRHGIARSRDQVEVIALAGVDDPRLYALPHQHAMVGRLSTAARVEGGAVEDDASLAVGLIGPDDRAVPVAQTRVEQVQPVRPAVMRHTHGAP